MEFYIQASSPRISNKFDIDDESISESIETIFLLNTEMALINWSGVFVPMSYKYTISTMIPDIILMIHTLIRKEKGELEIYWPSNDFNSHWILSWSDDSLVIKARWESVIGGTESLLNLLEPLKINKSKFITEWRALLEVILNALDICGYKESIIDEIFLLKEVCHSFKGHGLLYTEKQSKE